VIARDRSRAREYGQQETWV
jgi:hypothetical protein